MATAWIESIMEFTRTLHCEEFTRHPKSKTYPTSISNSHCAERVGFRVGFLVGELEGLMDGASVGELDGVDGGDEGDWDGGRLSVFFVFFRSDRILGIFFNPNACGGYTLQAIVVLTRSD